MPTFTGVALDPHTETLLRAFPESRVVVVDRNAPQQSLRQLIDLASSEGPRLVVVEATLRAEANALANLLDDPRVRNGVLLAHNPADVTNAEVRVDERGVVRFAHSDPADITADRPTAGILLVSAEDCPTFARALEQELPRVTQHTDPWLVAVEALAGARTVLGVPAAPFCASREAMELPRRSEDDRRLRASGSSADNVIIRESVRPVSRTLTRWSVGRRWRPDRLSLLGLGLGVLAGVLAGFGLLVTNIAAGVAVVLSGVAFLSSAELVRYWRRPAPGIYRRYALRRRIADAAVTLGLAAGVGATWGWVLGGAALAAVAISASLASSRAAAGAAEAHSAWPLRWLVTAVVLAVGGPAAGLGAIGLLALADAAVQLVIMYRHPQRAISPVSVQQRFLVPPGALLDAGVPLRVSSARRIGRWELRSSLLVAAAAAAVALGSALAWGRNPWLLALLLIAAVIALGQALRLPPRGPWAPALPAVARGVEGLVVITIASALGGTAPAAAAVLLAAVLLLSEDAADRWRLLKAPAPPWQPIADLGFDGRTLVLVIITTFSAVAGGWAAHALALVVLLVWLFGALSLSRSVSRIGGSGAQ